MLDNLFGKTYSKIVKKSMLIHHYHVDNNYLVFNTVNDTEYFYGAKHLYNFFFHLYFFIHRNLSYVGCCQP